MIFNSCRQFIKHFSLTLAFTALLVFSQNVCAQKNQTFALNIASNSLYDALIALAKKTQYELVIGRGVRFDNSTVTLEGHFTLEQAVTQLLNNTPFKISIEQQQIRIDTHNSPVTLLPKITVHGYFRSEPWGILLENDSLEAYPLHHLPLSVQSTTQNYFEEIEAKNAVDIIGYMSGIEYFEPSFGAHPLFYSRGTETPFGIDGKFHRRTSILMDNAVIERIDLIQGPSMNYTPPGGLLNFVTKRPHSKSRVKWKVSGGTYDFYRASLDINYSPQKKPMVNSRVILVAEDQKHFKDFADAQKYVLAPSVKLDIGENRSLLLSAYYQDEKEYPETLTIHEDVFSAALPRKRTIGLPWSFAHSIDAYVTADYTQTDFFGWHFNLGINWREAETSTWLTNMTNLVNRQGDLQPLYAYYEGVVDRFYGLDVALEKTMRLFDLDFSTRIGVDYQNYFQTIPNFGLQFPNSIFNVFNPDYSIPRPPIPEQIGEYTIMGDVFGLFLSNSFFLTDATTIYTEFRYEDMPFDGIFIDQNAGVDWAPSGHYKELTSQIGLNYTFNDTQSIHTAYTDSFSHQPIPNAGAVLDVMSDDADFLPPIKNRQIEAAYKHKWLDGKLASAVTAYKMVSFDIQTFSLTQTGAPTNGKARDQESKGFSLSLNGQFNTQISVIANINYNDSFITTRTAGGTSVYFFTEPSDENHRLRNTAKLATNLWLHFSNLNGALKSVEFGFGTQTFSDRYADNLNEFKMPSYTTFDAVIKYTGFEPFELSINAQNLTDRYYYAAGLGEALQFGDAMQIQEGFPRRIFLNIKSHFDF